MNKMNEQNEWNKIQLLMVLVMKKQIPLLIGNSYNVKAECHFAASFVLEVNKQNKQNNDQQYRTHHNLLIQQKSPSRKTEITQDIHCSSTMKHVNAKKMH